MKGGTTDALEPLCASEALRGSAVANLSSQKQGLSRPMHDNSTDKATAGPLDQRANCRQTTVADSSTRVERKQVDRLTVGNLGKIPSWGGDSLELS